LRKLSSIEDFDELDVYQNPNQECYPNQLISVVAINDYAYLVPYVESKNVIFLKRSYLVVRQRKSILENSHE